jgi:dienelactone hydrolase
MPTRDQQLSTPDGPMRCYEAVPDGEPRGAVVVIQEAFGAAAGFYGGGLVTARFPQFPALVGHAPTLQTPWPGLFGDRDGSIPVDDVEAAADAWNRTLAWFAGHLAAD